MGFGEREGKRERFFFFKMKELDDQEERERERDDQKGENQGRSFWRADTTKEEKNGSSSGGGRIKRCAKEERKRSRYAFKFFTSLHLYFLLSLLIFFFL